MQFSTSEFLNTFTIKTKKNLELLLENAKLTRPLFANWWQKLSTFAVFLRSSPAFFSASTICRAVLGCTAAGSVLACFPPRPAPVAFLLGGIAQFSLSLLTAENHSHQRNQNAIIIFIKTSWLYIFNVLPKTLWNKCGAFVVTTSMPHR